jgi:hypothetical protein
MGTPRLPAPLERRNPHSGALYSPKLKHVPLGRGMGLRTRLRLSILSDVKGSTSVNLGKLVNL